MIRLYFAFTVTFMSFLGQSALASEWYVGGNLHNTSLRAWVVASPENRLATSGDWLVSTMGRDWANSNWDNLRSYAQDLSRCVDEVAFAHPDLASSTAEIAAGCEILMGYGQ